MSTDAQSDTGERSGYGISFVVYKVRLSYLWVVICRLAAAVEFVRWQIDSDIDEQPFHGKGKG